MVIKHIVISGGSHKYMISYGILKRLHEKKFWDYSNIETIWATSSGTIVSLTHIHKRIKAHALETV